jgi:signal transduction histidine kinase
MNFLKANIAFYLLFFTAFLSAQSATTYHKIFGEHDGFDIDVVRAMNFDNDGFLWLGGENLDSRKIILSNRNLVLQRFNGRTFHNIRLPKLEERIVRINQIYKRKDGLFYLRVEVKNNKPRLLSFNPVSMEFKKIIDSQLFWSAISKVFNYNDEEYVLLEKENKIVVCKIDKNLGISEILTIKENKKIIDLFTRFIPFKNFFLLSDNHKNIVAYNWEGKKIKDFLKLKKSENEYLWIDEVFVNENSTYVFLFNDEQLYSIDEKGIEIIPFHNPNTTLKSEQLLVYNDAYGNNLIVSKLDNLLSVKSFIDGKFKKRINDIDFGSNYEINNISNNINEEFWITTEEKELHYFKLPSKKVKTFLENKSIRAIKQWNENEYIVATENDGWFIINIKNQKTKPYKTSKKGVLISTNSSRNIFIEKGFIFSTNLNNIFAKKIDQPKIESWDTFIIRCIEKLNDSILVYGSENHGIYEFNMKTKKHKPILEIDSLFFYDIAIHKNIIASATDKGVLFYNLENKKSEFYNTKNGLLDDFLLMADYDVDYGFLFGSRSGKISSFDIEKKEFLTLYEDDLKAGIATIIRDKDNLWIHTFNGFVLFNSNTKKTTRFGIEDGFSNNEANRYSAVKTKDGILVGTLKGLNYYKPADLQRTKNKVSLILLGIRKYDKKQNNYIEILNRKQLSEQKIITIPPENKNLELDFSVTNNSVAKQQSYRYRLNDENWTNLRNLQTIRFANLAAGNYSLEIEALDFSRKKIAKSIFLEINSEQFFYKTGWFYCILSLFGITFLIWFLKQTKEKNKMQEKFSQDLLYSQETERTRIARELHDSVGQQLTLIKRKAQNSTQQEIAELTNNALEEVRSISRGLYPALLKQLGLTESIEQLVHDYDEQANLFFSLDISAINTDLSESESLNFYRIIQECLTNVVKHSNATSVNISIKKENKTIITFIDDNGKGFDMNNHKNKNSLGLKTIFERIKILNGTISVNNQQNKGTNFIFTIPVK